MHTAPGQLPRVCPTCQTHHPVKTLHIWTGPGGEAMVSAGVLELLRRAGMGGFVLEGHTKKPPPLLVGRDGRAVQDNRNRAQVVYHPGQLRKETRFG